MPHIVKIPNINNLIKQYRAGKSLKQISEKSGIVRITLMRRFKKLGVKIRGSSEAERIKWAGMTSSQRSNQVKAANVARRGQVDTDITKVRRSQSFFERRLRIFPDEDEISTLLTENLLSNTQQYPVGPYNLDIKLTRDPIAIEIMGTYKGMAEWKRQLVRLKYLLNRNFAVIFIQAVYREGSYILDVPTVAKELIPFLQTRRLDPSIIGKYKMIWGDGNPPALKRFDFDGLPVIL